MSTDSWLLLTDYSSKYRISVSTLRRRIKLNQIPYRFDGGKYFILDASPTNLEVAAFRRETPVFPELKTFAVEPAPMRPQHSQVNSSASMDFADQLQVDQGFNHSDQPFDFELGTAPGYAAYHSAQAMRAAEPAELAAQEAFASAGTSHGNGSENSSGDFSSNSGLNSLSNSGANFSGRQSPEPLITTATNLLNELKRAYSNILQEKEEQMIQLKEEVSDLKTLVRVLEDQAERQRRQIAHYENR